MKFQYVTQRSLETKHPLVYHSGCAFRIQVSFGTWKKNIRDLKPPLSPLSWQQEVRLKAPGSYLLPTTPLSQSHLNLYRKGLKAWNDFICLVLDTTPEISFYQTGILGYLSSRNNFLEKKTTWICLSYGQNSSLYTS